MDINGQKLPEKAKASQKQPKLAINCKKQQKNGQNWSVPAGKKEHQ